MTALAVVNTDSVEVWADRVRTQMGRTVEGIVATGRELLAAKETLSHGEFLPMLELVGMSDNTAERFMAIASHSAIANSPHVGNLPPAYSTLYELSRVPAVALEAAIEAGEVRPDMPRREAVALVRRYQSSPTKPSAPAAKPKRSPLPDVAQRAGWEFRKSVERLERIAADDRFASNKEQVAAHLRGHLSYALEVCQDLLDQLDHQS